MTTSPLTTSPVSQLKSKTEQRQARVAIIGLGYVGLPLALLYTEEKFRVTGFDIDQRKVTTLTQGGSYIVRILPSEIQEARSRGFEVTADYARLAEMDAIIICVPTPLNEYHEPDLSYITYTQPPSRRICARASWWFWKARLILARPKRSWSRSLKRGTKTN
jgi:UDP-N-acetyl-D-glucosamine dehydrogenase